MNSKDIVVDNIQLKMLVYGKSGTGKTTFACGFPKPYVFDFDGGMLSQRGKDVQYDTYKEKTSNPGGAYRDFETKLNEFELECPYETLIIDSVTTMQEYMMDNILAMNRKKMMTLAEWNILIANLKDLFMRLTKMTSNIVVVAHEQMVQDEISGEVMYIPVIVGKKLPAQLPLWFDEVYRMQVARDKDGKPVYEMMTTADTRYTAKSRLNVMEPVEAWTDGHGYEMIMEKVRKGVKVE